MPIESDQCVEGAHPGWRALASAAAGALGGLMVGATGVLLDDAVSWPALVDEEAARATLNSLVATLVTLAVFTVWMRSVVVGLVSAQFSPRIVGGALGDRFQQRALTGAIVLVTASFVLAVRFPTGRVHGTPLASVAIGICLVLVGLLGVLHALRAGTAALALPAVVRKLTLTALEALEVLGTTEADDEAPPARGPTRARVHAAELGWVRAVDRDRLVRLLPSGACADLRVDVGALVAEGDVMIEVDDDAISPADAAATIEIRPVRCPHADIGFALQQLGDVALHALHPGGADASTAKEAVEHLGIVLERLVVVGIPSGHRVDGDRAVVAGARWQVEDHLEQLLDPLVVAAAQDPVAARQLDATLSGVEDRALEAERHASVRVLRDQRERVRAGDGWKSGASADGAVASRRRQPSSHPIEMRN